MDEAPCDISDKTSIPTGFYETEKIVARDIRTMLLLIAGNNHGSLNKFYEYRDRLLSKIEPDGTVDYLRSVFEAHCKAYELTRFYVGVSRMEDPAKHGWGPIDNLLKGVEDDGRWYSPN